MAIKAICLIRTSTIAQEIEEQKKQVLQMCYNDGLKDDEIEIVGGKGASAIKVDDAYQKNMNRVYEIIEHNDSVKCVYAWAIDRIGRKESILHTFREYLVNHQIQLKIKANNLVLLDENGKEDFGVQLQFSLYATLATAEMKNKQERMLRGRYKNREEGKANGGYCIIFGYEKGENKVLKPNRKELELLKTIYKDYSSGKYSISQITQEINDRGFIRKGKKFKLSTIKHILNHWDIYCGENENYNYVPILPKELCHSVRDMLQKSIRGRQRNYKNFFFANGIFYCPCGSKIVGNVRGNYTCLRKRHKAKYEIQGDEVCNYDGHNTIKTSVLDGILWEVAKECHTKFLHDLKTKNKTKAKNDIKIAKQKLDEINNKIEKIVEKKKRLSSKYVLEDLDEQELIQIRIKLKKQQDDLELNKVELEDKIKSYQNILDSSNSDRKHNELVFLEIFNLKMKEKDMFDLVHKYIKNGVICSDEDFEKENGDKYRTKIKFETVYGKKYELLYYSYSRSEHKTFIKEKDGEYHPFLYSDVIRKYEKIPTDSINNIILP